jgi:hypothetical protein
MDRRFVNIVDEAPTSIYEIAGFVRAAMEPYSEPLTNPWFGQLRSLGFQPVVATVHQSCREGAP